MVEPEKKLFGFKNGWFSPRATEERRLEALSELGLLQPETIPVFEEATQTAAHFLEAPISILGFMDQERYWFKSAVGLSRLGLMNHLAQNRQLLREESFCTQVVESLQIYVINDTQNVTDSLLKNSKLVKDFGIRAYLGVPLIDASGNCLGALAIMDLVPRKFTTRDIEFLQIIARWCMSEFERNLMLLDKKPQRINSQNALRTSLNNQSTTTIVTDTLVSLQKESDCIHELKVQLLGRITQELRTPLTSVLGMAGVLGREIYGPLTMKQREYVDIIEHSGRYLLSLVNEITEIGGLDENTSRLNLSPVNIEMLCQQAINSLKEAANRREQNIRLSIEPGYSRIWLLDKDKVRQILYHLIFGVIQLSATGSIVCLHVSYQESTLNITISVFHPWLEDGITNVDSYFYLNSFSGVEQTAEGATYNTYEDEENSGMSVVLERRPNLTASYSNTLVINSDQDLPKNYSNLTRESLGLLFGSQLAELHGGKISIQGSPESGHRYVLSLPLQQ
ncbi:GAF domain-containing sensor histidine kinase [Chrysosporum ovalisporum ANA283AFssAo]|uniref:sensor histidine kinase n=1 Tax=Umezakia ovalisporum TaxID=75695 RepID=UPI00247659C6|nr:GAF domain-containing sensor histidine kinase [Umezakia ovalisporum]MDH6104016.1 GAF domain-containing sensor histidine kinase [Umezakia ovalisporum ANA283AFssAo]